MFENNTNNRNDRNDKNNKNNEPRVPRKPGKCYYCESKSLPDYKDTLVLRRYITERGKIQPASRTDVCSKHQRKLSAEIKKARFMSLVYYTEVHSL